jgi:hypothetical protein
VLVAGGDGVAAAVGRGATGIGCGGAAAAAAIPTMDCRAVRVLPEPVGRVSASCPVVEEEAKEVVEDEVVVVDTGGWGRLVAMRPLPVRAAAAAAAAAAAVLCKGVWVDRMWCECCCCCCCGGGGWCVKFADPAPAPAPAPFPTPNVATLPPAPAAAAPLPAPRA